MKSKPTAKSSQKTFSLLFLLFAFAFMVLKIFNIGPRISDENWYFYVGSLMARGVVPYRDFFVAHPPGQFILYAVLIKLFGFRFTLLKILSPCFSIATAYFLYMIVKKALGSRAGLFAAAFFLFSFLTLSTTDFATGVHEATFFLILSWYLFSLSPILAGLALFLGLSVRLYILPAAIGFLTYQFLARRKRRDVIVYCVAFFLPFALANLSLYMLFGEKFFTPVWRYHILKTSIQVKERAFSEFLRNDVFLLLLAVGGFLMCLRVARRSKNRLKTFGLAPIDLCLSAASALALQYGFLSGLANAYLIYFVSIVPYFAVLAAAAVTFFLPLRSRRVAFLLLVALSLVNGFLYQKNVAGMANIEHFSEVISEIQSLTHKDETIFGAYIVTPIFAIYSDREITDYQGDTNLQRYLSGLFPVDEATRVATKSAIYIQKGIVDKETGEIKIVEPLFVDQNIIRSSCRLHRMYDVLKDYEFNALFLWDCRERTF